MQTHKDDLVTLLESDYQTVKYADTIKGLHSALNQGGETAKGISQILVNLPSADRWEDLNNELVAWDGVTGSISLSPYQGLFEELRKGFGRPE